MTHIISEQPRVVQRGGTPEASERSSSSVSTTAETIPPLQFSLYYDIQRRSLSVHLQQVYNLPAKDVRGTSDPFVVFFLLPNKEEIYESKIVHNPIFDQVFEFGSTLTFSTVKKRILFPSCYECPERILKQDSMLAEANLAALPETLMDDPTA